MPVPGKIVETTGLTLSHGGFMASALAKSQHNAQPEYSVYIYHHPENQLEGWNDWEMRKVTSDLSEALDEAKLLFESDEFEKVEVKRKSFDAHNGSVKDMTLKVYEHCKTAEGLQSLKTVLACACVLGGALAAVKILLAVLS